MEEAKQTQVIVERHVVDGQGNAMGGLTEGLGFRIVWQDGPLMHKHRQPVGILVDNGAVMDAIQNGKTIPLPVELAVQEKNCVSPNGAQLLDVIDGVIGRVKFLLKTNQQTANLDIALKKLQEARMELSFPAATLSEKASSLR